MYYAWHQIHILIEGEMDQGIDRQADTQVDIQQTSRHTEFPRVQGKWNEIWRE